MKNENKTSNTVIYQKRNEYFISVYVDLLWLRISENEERNTS